MGSGARPATGVVLVVSWAIVLGGITAGATERTASGDDGAYPVGRVARTFVDRTRRTPADPIAAITPAPRRVLPTTIYYPARRGSADGGVMRDARPARGKHPLVVFSPGAPGMPEEYEALLADWAAHGYVVAGIRFPVSSVAGPDAVAWRDLPRQTRDARFVLDRMLDLDTDKVGIPELDEDRIAVAGHSFGGATALSLVSDCCRDGRVDAVVALAAVTDAERGPRLERPTGPALFVHARGDRVVRYRPAARLCRRTRSPRRFVTVEGAAGVRAHVQPFLGTGEDATIVRSAIVDFLDGFLRVDADARARLDMAGEGTTVVDVKRCPPEVTSRG
jgi:pimeloyl-ACP methyl ester carboxylesterase